MTLIIDRFGEEIGKSEETSEKIGSNIADPLLLEKFTPSEILKKTKRYTEYVKVFSINISEQIRQAKTKQKRAAFLVRFQQRVKV